MSIFFLDDCNKRHAAFNRRCASGYCLADSAATAINALNLSPTPFDVAFLDHDLERGCVCESGPGSGYEVAEYITSMPPERRPKLVIVHSWNEEGAMNMIRKLGERGVRVRCEWIMFDTPEFWEVVEQVGRQQS